MTAKIAGVALAAGVATTGALAATGSLPASVQQTAANVAAHVGVSIPSPADHPGKGSHQSQGGKDNAAVTETVTEAATADANHGSCVSYAARQAGTLGLTGSERGDFVSTIAKDDDAISAKVDSGDKPDAACLAAIAKAQAAAIADGAKGNSVTGTANSDNGDTHGSSGSHPTSTATDNPTGNGPDSHPDGKPSPLPTPTHPGRP
jgi:hypothetical protein